MVQAVEDWRLLARKLGMQSTDLIDFHRFLILVCKLFLSVMERNFYKISACFFMARDGIFATVNFNYMVIR